MIAKRSYDCLVIGAGPGGCATASIVAEQGLATLLIERDKMPRFHVGESLMPECYWLFERLGILNDIKRMGFTKKHGVQICQCPATKNPNHLSSAITTIESQVIRGTLNDPSWTS